MRYVLRNCSKCGQYEEGNLFDLTVSEILSRSICSVCLKKEKESKQAAPVADAPPVTEKADKDEPVGDQRPGDKKDESPAPPADDKKKRGGK